MPGLARQMWQEGPGWWLCSNFCKSAAVGNGSSVDLRNRAYPRGRAAIVTVYSPMHLGIIFWSIILLQSLSPLLPKLV